MAYQMKEAPVSWNFGADINPTTVAEAVGRGLARSLDNVEKWIEVLRELGEVEILNEYEAECAALFGAVTQGQAKVDKGKNKKPNTRKGG